MKKRLLFIEDLYDFYSNKYKRSTHFSAKKSGHQIFVQVPAEFEVDKNTKYKDDSLLFCKVKLMHSGKNRNHSSVTDDALRKASKTLAYKPILANFMEYTDELTGETLKDFTSHDMELNDNGTVEYIEKQIGCFTSDEPYFEIEEETGHNFLYGYCAIPTEYTDAYSIIKRKNGTKVSVELGINEMSYNAKSNVLELTDVVIMGATCLGKDPNTLEDIGEGMLNARLDIADFSAKKNSLFTKYENQMIEFQERLEKLESTCINKNNSRKGGESQNMTKLEKLLKKYNKTIDDITFEYKGLSDDELTVKFAEIFDDTNGSGEDTGSEEGSDESGTDTPTDDTSNDDSTGDGDNTHNTISDGNTSSGGTSDTSSTSIDDENSKRKKQNNSASNKMVRTYELSHDDIRSSLYVLLEPYEETDNDYYWIMEVFDSYFVYQGYMGKTYGQKYKKDGDNVSFDGERYEVFMEYLTESEKTALAEMRSNYAALKEFKETAEKNELHAQREKIINSKKYAVLAEKDESGRYINEAFAKLASGMDNYSLIDLETQIKVLHSDYIAEHSNFSVNDEVKTGKKDIQKKQFSNPSKVIKTSRYGKLFQDKDKDK